MWRVSEPALRRGTFVDFTIYINKLHARYVVLFKITPFLFLRYTVCSFGCYFMHHVIPSRPAGFWLFQEPDDSLGSSRGDEE